MSKTTEQTQSGKGQQVAEVVQLDIGLTASHAAHHSLQRKFIEYADAINNRYPLDTAEQIRMAWSYIHQRDSVRDYDQFEAATMKERIRFAARRQGIDLGDNRQRRR